MLFLSNRISNIPQLDTKLLYQTTMYSQRQTTASMKVQPSTYCKVCADAKKPVSMVTSHNVRNLKNGAITCPTLLEQHCKNCSQKGHTSSRCKKNENMKEPEIKKPKQGEPTKKDRTVSAFSALMSDSDSEADAEVEVAEEVEEVKAPSENRVFMWPKKLVVKNPNRKFMWADCDSDSGGSEDEDEAE